MMISVGLILLSLASETLQRTPEDPSNVRVITKNIELGFRFKKDLALSNVRSHRSRVMCIFDSQMTQMEGQTKFEMEHIDATLCTHLIFRPLQVKDDENGKRGFALVDRNAAESEELFRKAVELKKQQNPELKVIVSFGGWNEGVYHFQKVSTSSDIRSKFVRKVVNFLKRTAFDGLVVEWMWPGVVSSGGKDGDKNAVTELIASLSKEMKAQNLELGVTLPADTSLIETGYNISALEGNVDYFILAGELENNGGPVAGHHSPLLPLTGRTVGNSVKFVLDKKISAHKVILGIPFVGRKLKLEDAHVDGSGLGDPILKETGIQSAFSVDSVLNYNQVCYDIRNRKSVWTVYEDTEVKVRFMRDGEGNWVSFDDTKSVRAKVEFGVAQGLGGYAAWSITTDDFVGDWCDEGFPYPLLKTINYVLSKKESEAKKSNPKDRDTNRLNVTSPTTARNNSESPQSTKSNEAEGRKKKNGSDDDGSSVVTFVVVSLLGMSLLLVPVLFLVWRKRRGDEEKVGKERGLSNSEIRRFMQGYNYDAAKDTRNSVALQQLKGEQNINCNPYDISLEVPHTEYEICADEILGSGAYGVVVKGSVRNEVVAVKTVKPLSSKGYLLSVLEEIKVMTYLGQHENILGLIGANTALLRRGIVYVFVEYCSLGMLENYLKANRVSFVDLMKNDEFTCEKSKAVGDGEGISSGTLLIWAHQISNGMQFLSSKKVIHGDLGTRYVLVRSKNLVKISGFVSSRKMCVYSNWIEQKEEEHLPWRHMSLETLTNLEFSTQSDVWAFGVTLWEIFSLGSLPYPGMSYAFGFTDDLIGGRRMSKPKYATTELYEKTMLETWNENPKDRPSFEELSTFLRESVKRVYFQQKYTSVEIQVES